MQIKFKIAFILILLCCIPAFGQTALPASGGHGITVVNQNWKFVKRAVFVKSSTVSNGRQEMEQAQRARSKEITPLPPTTVDEMGKRDIVSSYSYKATFKNDGQKSVNEIIWQYVFLDPATRKELGRRQFISRKSIRPGSKKTFDEKSSLPPANVISASSAVSNFDEQYVEEIRIKAVKYSDGSVWEAPN